MKSVKSNLPDELQDLIDRFERNKKAYTNSKYNETQVRREFIDPFFELLGWDVSNSDGMAEQYKDVIHEDAIKIQGSSKAPDYCFRLSGERKFFVEAKKPSVNIKDSTSPAFQVRRYGWSAKLPLSILTDFQEFAIYDCRIKPNAGDSSVTARILYFKYDELPKYWEKLKSIFSKDSVQEGSFDQYVDENEDFKGVSEVDQEFLSQLEGWRETLAKNLVLRNKGLSTEDLNFSVQRTLDRILFFRISEDRGLEESKRLSDAIEGANIYQSLCSMFREADDKYNSGLFHFHKSNDRPTPPDELSLELKIDDKILKEIIEGLYYPASPYEFSVMPIEILGQVYEKFLGKEILVSDSGKINIKEKPLVKKAGGVFYTPEYIVNKIVRDTIGPILKGKTPQFAAKIKILDASCGSGSFLIGAYDYILNWHLNWYLKNRSRSKNKIYQNANGHWHLTPTEKKSILLNNIYGVDIDAQAVETTKLSLCLKVLEGETRESVEMQLSLFKEQALPDIGDNIKCGNSLVGSDLELDKITMDEMYKINPFDWGKEFPTVFDRKEGGFDIIIGNPPYLRVQGLNEFHGNEIAYYSSKYRCAVKRFDLYLIFIERCFELLSKKGVLGFICPHKFTNADFGKGIRGFLRENSAVKKLISFDHNTIFEQASTYTCLLYLTKKKQDYFEYVKSPILKTAGVKRFLRTLTDSDFNSIPFKSLDENPWELGSSDEGSLFEKLKAEANSTLGDMFDEVMVGVQSGIDDIHLVKHIKNAGKDIICYSKEMKSEIVLEKGILKPILKGDDISSYEVPKSDHYCIYPYKLVDGKTKIIEEKELAKNFPLAYTYLKSYKKKLKDKRIAQKTNSTFWYSCHRSKDLNVFESKRIITPEISLGCNMTIGTNICHNTQVYSLVPSKNRKESLNYFLAILNSNVMWWFISNTSSVLRGGYYRFKTNYMKPFPMKEINFNNKDEKAAHDLLDKLATSLLEFRSDLNKAKSPMEKRKINTQINVIETKINTQVYKLYNLSEQEIAQINSTSVVKKKLA